MPITFNAHTQTHAGAKEACLYLHYGGSAESLTGGALPDVVVAGLGLLHDVKEPDRRRGEISQR